MFNRFVTDFSEYTAAPSILPQTTNATLTLGADLILETPEGFTEARGLTAGDKVATLDGGFAQIVAVRLSPSPERAFKVPAGALGNDSDIILPAESHVALTPPQGLALSEAPYISLPATALVGFRGIRPTLFNHQNTIAFEFEQEEMVWAQTGLLLHARPKHDGFFTTLAYGDARAVLALLDCAQCGPDLTVAA